MHERFRKNKKNALGNLSYDIFERFLKLLSFMEKKPPTFLVLLSMGRTGC